MIKRMLIACAVAGLLVGGGTGCIVHTKSPKSSRAQKSSAKKRDCAPSHYWDGSKCRHKGKGKGARKHDY